MRCLVVQPRPHSQVGTPDRGAHTQSLSTSSQPVGPRETGPDSPFLDAGHSYVPRWPNSGESQVFHWQRSSKQQVKYFE